MNDTHKLNTWLNPLIQNYINYFGLTERPVVWEVGSRDGKDGAEIATRIYTGSPDWFWSRARVVALEANPKQAKIIENNYPEIEVMAIAASNQKGTAPFIVYAGDEGEVGSSSLDLHWKEGVLDGHIITVPIDRLDNLIGDEQIDIMKIDCEGHSLEVVEGLGNKIKQVKCFHIETEKWTDSNIKLKPIMQNHGYILVDETEQYGGMPDQVWIRQ